MKKALINYEALTSTCIPSQFTVMDRPLVTGSAPHAAIERDTLSTQLLYMHWHRYYHNYNNYYGIDIVEARCTIYRINVLKCTEYIQHAPTFPTLSNIMLMVHCKDREMEQTCITRHLTTVHIIIASFPGSPLLCAKYCNQREQRLGARLNSDTASFHAGKA